MEFEGKAGELIADFKRIISECFNGLSDCSVDFDDRDDDCFFVYIYIKDNVIRKCFSYSQVIHARNNLAVIHCEDVFTAYIKTFVRS